MSQKLADLIGKAGKTERILEFSCPYVSEFYVKIAYASKFVLNQIRELSREFVTVRGREREERLNEDKLREEYAKRIVQDWRGLTLTKLNSLFPGIEFSKAELQDLFKDKKIETEEDMKNLVNKEMPYHWKTAKALLDNSLEIELWVTEVSGELANYSALAKQKEKEEENL